MTVNSTVNKVEHIANGVLVDFDFTFEWNSDPSTIQVWLDGVLQIAGYTVTDTGTPGVGGRVTFDTAPADQVTVTIVREMPLTQQVDYTPYDPFPAETHEDALDKLTMLVQQQQEALDRTFKAPIAGAEPGVDYTMPPYDAGKGLMWHETLKQFDNTPDNISDIVSDANAAADRAEAAADRAEAAEVAMIGTVVSFMGETPPTGWLECDGSSLSTTTYAALFAVIGYMYGGSGGNFNLPDLRGYFLRGQDGGQGIDPDAASRTDRGDGTAGDNVGTKQADELKSHQHSYTYSTGTYTVGSGPDPVRANATSGANTGNTGGNETRPVNINVKHIIKY